MWEQFITNVYFALGWTVKLVFNNITWKVVILELLYPIMIVVKKKTDWKTRSNTSLKHLLLSF